jgi:hypothetical protein
MVCRLGDVPSLYELCIKYILRAFCRYISPR